MPLKCVVLNEPKDWEIPRDYVDRIHEWLGQRGNPFYKRTMADVWFVAAMIGFRLRQPVRTKEPRSKSIPCGVFKEDQVLMLRLAMCRLKDDEFRSFLDDREVHEVLFPYMHKGLETLRLLFKDVKPTFYQQKLVDLLMSPETEPSD